MEVKKIFLASSSELRADRDQFRIAVADKSNLLADLGKDTSFRVVVWENFVDALSLTRLQDEYNKAIGECDIFVMLYHTKVGKYTEEEFDVARQLFQNTGKPKVYTYFKSNPVDPSTTSERDRQSLEAFDHKLRTIGHFKTPYASFDSLENHFKDQLDKLMASGFFRDTKEEEDLKSEALIEKIKDEMPRTRLSKLIRKYQAQLEAINPEIDTSLILLLSRCKQLEGNISMGIISNQDANIQQNQLNVAFLSILGDLEDL